MTHEEIEYILAEAKANNEKGHFAEAERICREAIADTNDPLFRSRFLRQLAFSLRRSGKGLEQESLEAAEEALSLTREIGNQIDIADAMTMIGASYHHLFKFPLALEYYTKALAMFEESAHVPGIAETIYYMGLTYKFIGDHARSLECYFKAHTYYETLEDTTALNSIINEIAQVYMALGLHEKAIEYYTRTLAAFRADGNRRMVAGTISNIGGGYLNLGNYETALAYFHEALSALDDDELAFRATITGNIGVVHYFLSEYSNALEYFLKDLALNLKLNNKGKIAGSYARLSAVYAVAEFSDYNPEQAEEYLLKAIDVFEELEMKSELFDAHKDIADLYKQLERWKEFGYHFEQYHNLEKEVQSNAALQKAEQLEQQKQAVDREKSLAVERADAEATKRLLHKTLPKSIADRVMLGETRIADHFENASILFADVVGFTEISSKMLPAAVLAFMNFIFEHFDSLAAKHGCERIKTIGDGYMAVCGAPVRYPNHSERLALMALEMMEDIKLPEEIREHLPAGTLFHLRIGLHCGEITAGLIGTGKLAYDIYGDAVNTAARMESHGEAGRIHVSEEFRNVLISTSLNELPIEFISRGEMEIKGKGIMKTYFLEKA
ncbi:MAG: tetratricopeptide repeat protein [Bacteroidetes bacterium]|nr:tetratricopeptide repeat protein [Bacteroidota bacterium]